MWAELSAGERELRSQLHRETPRDPSAPRDILVSDSDNEDSLGFSLLEAPSNCSARAVEAPVLPKPPQQRHRRIFSKRASTCAAALLQSCLTASTTQEKKQQMRQVAALGGAYKQLASGSPFTIWMRYADLSAHAIAETESFLQASAPQGEERRCTARCKATIVQQGSDAPIHGGLTLGFRTPLPSSSHESGTDRTTPATPATLGADQGNREQPIPEPPSFSLSAGEQFALSLLSLGDSDTPNQENDESDAPTYICLRRDDGSSQRTRVEGEISSLTSQSLHPDSRLAPQFIYDEEASQRATPTTQRYAVAAAGGGDSPVSAAVPGEKRHRDIGRSSCRSVEEAEVMLSRKLATLSSTGIAEGEIDASGRSFWNSPPLPSLSASLIHAQNGRTQHYLLRQQSLLLPY